MESIAGLASVVDTPRGGNLPHMHEPRRIVQGATLRFTFHALYFSHLYTLQVEREFQRR